VLVDQTVTYLEMTSADQLLPGKVPTGEITLDRVDRGELDLIRSTIGRIGTPHHWSSLAWPEQQWLDVLARPSVRSWIARVGIDVIGMVQMETHHRGDVEIWDLGAVNRVWLHTSSFDHPHALPNYCNRGFRPFRVEHRPRELPTGPPQRCR